ncbi:uncharacterized protein LOC132627523 [Lycium barbarum]|uniref:uncharacterized protein LOC132627523 n=1 Tax=Lycium barbarum TaxID=112863 RepID=UPI00293ED897|nr:uncharacterized protein LOC132627523 [Lycium barbarum]XP_060198892.1 uncharacterized protein LOC132627523 [Lycium barbarum]XP_060198893.1 uncharacterized protein LOC132627523 [Lycium barbarum]XP_060198894.1 uncharacterized protein LOC132627523 [Lycium barbarum]XP_060198895.1 uncharacterized protein LOC132627523 [Lycium barbarum]
MAICNCFCGPVGRSRKDKGDKRVPRTADEPVLVESSVKSTAKTDDSKSSSFVVPLPFGGSSKVMNHESPVKGDTEEVAYEGEDEHDESLSMKRDNSDFDLQARGDQSFNEEINRNCSFESEMNDQDHNKSEEIVKSGHISDPGFGKVEPWASPRLQRSCSDLAMRDMLTKLSEQLSLSKSKSFDEMQRLAEKMTLGSPTNSVLTHRSADRVMLKKHSSTQLLPSRSRKLWWKLFLWSHRNLQGTGAIQQLPILPKTALNQQGGYCSDTLELGKGMDLNKGRRDKGKEVLDDFQGGVSGFWPQNQWVAFPEESSRFMRINEWVNELPSHPPCLIDEHDHVEDEVEASKSPARSSSLISPHPNINVREEVAHANTVIRSLNSSSTVAHIAGTGLKVIPAMSHLSSLRSVNLSGNFIVQITPGSLPKGLHVLNLSRNKIHTIEGLRELTRLRVLDLSYNRISRIGQGLSNCTLIKELYLAGNKVSDIEGLHRLLKLTVLDLSFNKITTTKALGQLVANYNSLLALNLLGNPIQINISDDQLRKAVRSLLPKLAFLNKQPVNSQKAREVGTEAVAKAALGNSTRGTHRRAIRKVSTGASSSSSVYRSSASVAQKSRHRLRSRAQHQSSKAK